MTGTFEFIRRRPIATIALAGFGLLVLLTVRNLVRQPQDGRLTSIRRAGYPVTLSELNTYYPAVADAQNAALLYQRSFQSELFTNHVAQDLTENVVIKRGDSLPADHCAEIAEAQAKQAEAWQLLYSATNCGGSRYPMDLREGYMVMLPHLANVKQAALLLSLEGLAHASRGESNQAYAAFNAALHATDSVQNEPILISFLVRIACARLVAKRVEEALNLVGLDEAQLRSLQSRFGASEGQQWPARAFAGERAFGLAFFIDRNIQRTVTRSSGQAVGGIPTGFSGTLAFTAYRASGLMARDQEFYLDRMQKTIEQAELSTEERIQKGVTLSMTTSNKLLVLSRLLLPALQQALGRADEHSARMRVAETALGVERFRVTHSGTLPRNLEELVPGCLKAVPLDPYDSKPLRYKQLPSGFVVYSVGPDRHDDGGAEPPSPEKGAARSKSTPMDITFVVERN